MMKELDFQCVCGSTDGQRGVFSDHFDRVRCSSCNTNRFVGRLATEAVRFDYSGADDKYSDPAYLEGSELRWAHRRLLAMNWASRRVLEVGCFNGFFVRRLIDAGAQGFGVDANRAALAVGAANHGLGDALYSSLEGAATRAPFDDLICIDLLEHLESPSAFLRECLPLMSEQARIVIAGPTVERRFFDKSDFPPHHIWRFSRPGLMRLLARFGFQEERIEVQHDPILFVRNFLGRLANGYAKREFTGEVRVAAPRLERGMGSGLYAGATRFAERVAEVLGFEYCSTLLIARRARPVADQ